tara:strand:- start:32 stop:385 length:354 start_codon:yes stop_codon:yes gene_type:complete
MSQYITKIHALYEEFITNMRTLAPKVDAILLLKAMRLEKMFPGDLPHAHLEIDFADDVDINIPKYQISEKFVVATSVHRWEKTKLVVSGKMSVDNILEIAGHEKVVKIMGYANASHY